MAENQARENAVELRASFFTREFLRAKPDEFHGGPKPKKANEWPEQTVKTFEVLHIDDSELRVTLASYYLKGDVGQCGSTPRVEWNRHRKLLSLLSKPSSHC